MKASEQSRFDRQYRQHLTALKLQGKADATIDSYARAVRRIAEHFKRSPDSLSAEEFKTYFSGLVDSHSWSTVKVDLHGLRFFFVHALKREWPWVDLIRPPVVRHLPDVLTADEVARLILGTAQRRYQTFWLLAYSTGLRLSEALHLQVSDIDAQRQQVHVRDGKGRKDRFVYLPDLTLRNVQMLLGHACPKTTVRYVHMTDACRDNGHATIEALMDQLGARLRAPRGAAS